jgi:hypothetical protein
MTAKLALLLCFIIFADSAHSKSMESKKLNLLQTGEPASVHSPACAATNQTTAADMMLKAGAAAIDYYYGTTVATTILEKTPPGNRNWLKVRLGIHNGQSTCGSVCMVVPTRKKLKYEACQSESGGDGEACRSTVGDLPRYAAVSATSKARAKRGQLVCATGKNWSHNADRLFWIRATY